MTPNTDTFHAVDTHRQKLCLLNLVQGFIEVEALLLLTF